MTFWGNAADARVGQEQVLWWVFLAAGCYSAGPLDVAGANDLCWPAAVYNMTSTDYTRLVPSVKCCRPDLSPRPPRGAEHQLLSCCSSPLDNPGPSLPWGWDHTDGLGCSCPLASITSFCSWDLLDQLEWGECCCPVAQSCSCSSQ